MAWVEILNCAGVAGPWSHAVASGYIRNSWCAPGHRERLGSGRLYCQPGRPAKKGRQLARKRPCSDHKKNRGEPRLAPLIVDSARSPSCHAWLGRSRWPAVCCGAPLCYAPESCRVHAPPNPPQGSVRLHRRPRHVFASRRAATQSPQQSTHRMFPVFVADLGRGSPHLRSWPAAATRRRPARPAAGVAARVPPARRDGGAPRAVRRPARRGRRRGCAGARADAPPAAVHNHLRGRPERQDARRARRSRQRHGRTPPSRQAGSAPRRVEPCPTNYLRLCSNEQLLELLAWFGLTGNDDHFADVVPFTRRETG